jgi:Lrp/AsnC family transcriptional regulator for asnA, asnC and gidA
VLVFAFFRDTDELYVFLQKEVSGLDGIAQMDILTIHQMKKRYNHLFPKRSLSGPPIALDDADDRIIRELEKDGRQSYKKISDTTGIATSTISRRVNYLQKHNVIKICALPNPLKLGFPVHAFIKIEADNNKMDSICTTLDKHKNVNMIGIAFGQCNIVIVVHFPDISQLTRFVAEELAFINGVRSIDTIVTDAIKKRYYGWILSEEMVSESRL